MRRSAIVAALSRRSPSIVGIGLTMALLAYWLDVPVMLPDALALLLGCIAIIVMAGRKRDQRLEIQPEPDAAKSNWIEQELAGNGSAPGSYVLAFFAVITIGLTGFVGPYALPGWAALALSVAWGLANARNPGDEV